jgi:hypothetical protein
MALSVPIADVLGFIPYFIFHLSRYLKYLAYHTRAVSQLECNSIHNRKKEKKDDYDFYHGTKPVHSPIQEQKSSMARPRGRMSFLVSLFRRAPFGETVFRDDICAAPIVFTRKL